MRQPGQDLYGLAVWLHNSPIVPPDLEPGLEASVRPCSPGTAHPGVHMSHREPLEEGTGLGTHSPCSLREQALLESRRCAPPARMGALGQQGAAGLPGREAEALPGRRAQRLPGVETEHCSSCTAVRRWRQLSKEVPSVWLPWAPATPWGRFSPTSHGLRMYVNERSSRSQTF